MSYSLVVDPYDPSSLLHILCLLPTLYLGLDLELYFYRALLIVLVGLRRAIHLP